MTAKDIMIDIETLSTATDALVLSIGVTPFFCTSEAPYLDATVGQELIIPDLVEQLMLGRRVDRETQLWWQRQPDEAQAHWRNPDSGTAGPVAECLRHLNGLITKVQPSRIWARGSHFDIAILDSLYQTAGIKPAWKYNQIRDVRTYCDDAVRTRNYAGAGSNRPLHHPLRDNWEQIVSLWEHGMGGSAMSMTPPPVERECAGGPSLPTFNGPAGSADH